MQARQPDAQVLKLHYFAIHGFKANGLVQYSLGQRPRNKENICFLWPKAIFILVWNGLIMAVGQTDSFRVSFQGRCPWLR